MCGRFNIAPDGATNAYIDEANVHMRRYMGDRLITPGDMLPSMYIPTLSRGRKGSLLTFPMHWGYLMNGGKLLINARSETAADKTMFRYSRERRRCVIPFDSYYEWQRTDVPKAVKYMLQTVQPGKVFLAGIYRYGPDPRIPECVILTREASREISFIHDRMPVIFSESFIAPWINGDIGENEIDLCSETEMLYAPAG